LTREEFERGIMARAVKDAAFRDELVKDPKGVLQREVAKLKEGFNLPGDLEVTVVQETARHIYLRLPMTASMNEDELKAMTGGTETSTVYTNQAMALDVSAVIAPTTNVSISIDVTQSVTVVATAVMT
jgi:hypothetical protein